jgi:Zn-dependent protease with chaperone function/competence protein ComGC
MNPTTPNPTFAPHAGQLNVPKEKTYLIVVSILSVIVWLLLVISGVGILYAGLFALLGWMSNGLLTAHLRAEAVRVNQHQLPELHATFEKVWAKLGGRGPLPRLYVIQAGGSLNAFATRFSGRNFVVVYSDLLEAFGPASDEMQFLLGHEVGHIQSNHLLKQLMLMPGLLMPLIGPAYLRACEASCDRHGAFAADHLDGAVRAMLTLGGGRNQGRLLNAAAFANQHGEERGLFVSWHELTSGYPTLSARTAQLLNLAQPGSAPSAPARNPLAYFLAAFTPGGRMAAGGNILVFVMIIGLLAAMAIPAFAKVRQNSQEKACHNNRRMLTSSYELATLDNGKPPASYADFIGPGKQLTSMPTCPDHGEYEVTALQTGGTSITCSVHKQ